MTQRRISYERVMTRDAPLILTVAWYQSFMVSIPRVFDFKIRFPEPIFLLKNGAVESWRATHVFFGELPKAISRWLTEPTNVQKLFNAFDQYRQIREELRKEKTTPIVSIESSDAVRKIQEITNRCQEGLAGLIPAYWCVTWNGTAIKETNKPLFSQEIVDRATQLRRGDTFFDDAVDLVYQYLYLIAKNQHWPKRRMKFFLFQGLEAAVLKKQQPDFAELRKREDGCAYFKDQLWMPHDITSALEERGYQLIESALPASIEVQGVSASPGNVRGHVKVVMNREQLSKVTAGDILVSSMTTPAYLPAMMKAAAFVTDEGGVICHAAIISREMKKPCIVGTKVATQVLKDGDLVEVDAVNGIVKKI